MKAKVFIAAIILIIGTALTLQAQDTSAQQSRKANLEREIALLDKQLSENASKSRSALSELNLINSKISARKELISESEKQIASMTVKIRAKEKQTRELQANLDTLSQYYTRLVRSAYKNRDAKIWYMYILASENLGQAFRRYSYFKNLSAQMKVQADKITALKKEVEAQKVELQKLRSEELTEKNKLSKELTGLQKEQNQADKVVADLKRNRKKYEREINAKKKQVAALNREIERMIAEAMGGGSKTSSKKNKPKEIDYVLAAEFSKNKGKLPWPVSGPVVGRFGKQYHPVFRNLELPPNNGVDIAAAKDAQAKAVFKGVVKQVFVMPGYNQCVLIQHGNYFTLYCKLKSLNVSEGDKVKTSDIIGSVDAINGQVQLHFEVWKGSKPQNPEGWLK
jgi:septal ring factor EnvC (AmiA/AmiB activator)